MLELKNINVSFRSERQDKIFGHTRQQVLFDVSLTVKEGTCLGILGETGLQNRQADRPTPANGSFRLSDPVFCPLCVPVRSAPLQ